MILKYFIPISICVTLFFSIQLHAQERNRAVMRDSESYISPKDSLQNSYNLIWKPTTSAFVELMGKGFLSLNVDFRKKQSYAISIGLQPTEGLMPDIMYYHFSGERYRFELGGGFSTGFNKEIELAGVLIHGVIGYRYQKKKGLLFRVGFTPLYVIFIKDKNGRSNKLYPFVGVSLGYSF